jgi:hypothetical protein
MKKQATRKGAISAMRPDTPEANFLLAMFGKAVSAPNGRRMAELAIDCAHQRELALAVPEKFDWKARRNKWLGPQLAELLGDALAELDAKPFEDFAAVIRQAATMREQRRENHKRPIAGRDQFAGLTHGWHGNAIQLASIIRLENHLPHNGLLPGNAIRFLERLDPKRIADVRKRIARENQGRVPHDALHDALALERRELAHLGIRFTAKRGRPKKGTANR